MPVVIVDYVLIVVIGLSAVISLFRGFFKEAVSLGTWVVALWLAWRLGPQVAGMLEPWIGTSVLRLWAARVLVVIAALLGGGLLGWFFGQVLDSTGLSGTDRAIGTVFGFARGVLLAGLLVMILDLLGFREAPWWEESKLIPYAAPVADIIRHAAEDGMEYLEELDTDA
ncbi:MAG: CvpA family protein [Gammaproteobacteria bacterium]|jgi:membrane protein required for colicin V production